MPRPRIRIRPRLSYANVAASLALFVALGGTAAAAVVVNSNQDIAPGTIFGSIKPAAANDNVVDGSLGANDLAAGAVTNPKVAPGAIGLDKLASHVVTGKGGATFGRLSLTQGGSGTLLPVAGLGSLVASCAPFAGTLQFHNTSGQPVTVFMDDVAFTAVNTIDNGALSPATPNRFLNHLTYQVSRGTGARGQMATIDVFETSDDAKCSFQAQSVSLGS
ncbi:MAG TPA: hypothetical protein VGH45_13080 [Solirubrobacteraceae bacterium]|jgi:hypothetical protein